MKYMDDISLRKYKLEFILKSCKIKESTKSILNVALQLETTFLTMLKDWQ